jgi:hypothetical protein
MSTDWDLVRKMMSSAIDSCERLEHLGVTENDRGRTGLNNGATVSIFDVLTSAWIYPETLRYKIIRQRNQTGNDQPYVPETARVLTNVAQACAELIGAGKSPLSEPACQGLVQWYEESAVPLVEDIMKK